MSLSLHDALPICGGKGIFTCKLTEDTGHVSAVKAVTGDEDIMLITVGGVLIRIPVESIAQTGRNTQGVRLIRLQNEEEVATVAKISEEDMEEEIEVAEGEIIEDEAIEAEEEESTNEEDE